jgi:hypothetical protein
MSGSLKCVGIALTVLLAVGCDKRGSRSPDPCGDGGCAELEQCELGTCDFGFDPNDTTITAHSPNAGSFADGTSATCPFDPSELPPEATLLDDSKVPQFNRGRARATNYSKHGGFLQDHQIHEHMLGYQGHLFDCLDMAACYSEEVIGSGELDFQFELEPNGKVSAVSVTTSDELTTPVVLACARRSLYDFKFPAYNGARMVVSYSVEISADEY